MPTSSHHPTASTAGGRAVKIDADQGADALRAIASRDEGAGRLGEIALVDKEGHSGPLDTVFLDTLIDERRRLADLSCVQDRKAASADTPVARRSLKRPLRGRWRARPVGA